ncbi:MAG: methylenetetrahydrofolate reductase [Candidatus Hodgkinia cicadicola]
MPNVNVNLSVEFFPPKHKHAFVALAGDYALARCYSKFKFVSLTCGASGANKHNSYKLLLALTALVPIINTLVHLICVDKSTVELWTFIKHLKRLGVNKLLFLKGDYYANSQIRPDVIDALKIIKQTRLASLSCATTSYPEVYNLSACSNLERMCFNIKRKMGCTCSLTQFFNVVNTFIKSSIRANLISGLQTVPGFVVSVKRQLSCRISAKCGVYIHDFVKRLIATDCKLTQRRRTVAAYMLTKLFIAITNNVSWLHVFALNKFRSFHKLVWIFAVLPLIQS